MKKLALALLMLTLTLPVTAGQSELAEVVEEYLERGVADDLTLMVVHLNDITTDALFTAPSKYSLRAQARQSTMFYVQGDAKSDHRVDVDFRLRQGTTVYRTKAVSLDKFEAGVTIQEGEQFQGILTLDSSINLRAPFVLTSQDYRLEFEFSRAAVDRLEPPQ